MMHVIRFGRTADSTGITVLVLVGALLLAPLCFLGYGTWPNIYMMLSAGKSTWIDHLPQTSRPPGYWTYEAVMFVTSQVGGYILTNLVNLAVSLADIYLVYVIAIRWRAHFPLLCAAIVAVHPTFLVEATSAQDFNMSLMFVLLGVLALDSRQFWIAGACCGIACTLRLSAIVPVGAIYAAFLLVQWGDRRDVLHLVLSGALAFAMFVVACIPSYLVLGPTFYKGYIGPDEMWNAKTWIGRVVYKTFYFFGGPIALLGVLALLAALMLGRDRPKMPSLGSDFSVRFWIARNRYVVLTWVALAGCLALFVKFPIRQSYLIVALPFFALAVDQIAGRVGRALPWVIIIALLSQNFILFNIAKPNIPGRATSGSFALGVEPGYLLVDIRDRQRFMECDSLECHARIYGPQP